MRQLLSQEAVFRRTYGGAALGSHRRPEFWGFSMRKWLRAATVSFFLIGLLLLAACVSKQSVDVFLTAPPELAGADLFLDTALVGQLELYRSDPDAEEAPGLEGSQAVITVPLGAHEVLIKKDGYDPIVRKLSYSRGGEDYLAILDGEISQALNSDRKLGDSRPAN